MYITVKSGTPVTQTFSLFMDSVTQAESGWGATNLCGSVSATLYNAANNLPINNAANDPYGSTNILSVVTTPAVNSISAEDYNGASDTYAGQIGTTTWYVKGEFVSYPVSSGGDSLNSNTFTL